MMWMLQEVNEHHLVFDQVGCFGLRINQMRSHVGSLDESADHEAIGKCRGLDSCERSYEVIDDGAVLVVDLQDAEHTMFYPNGTERFIQLSFALPRNGSMVLMQGDGSLYTFSQTDASFFWSIFGVIREELW